MNKDDLVNIELSKDDFTGCQIDSLTIHTKVKKLLKLIDSPDISNINKIKIAKFLSYDTYDYIKLSLDKCDIIIRNMSEVITRSGDLQDSIRLNYLKYKNEYISFNISINLYRNNIRNVLSIISYFQILKQIMRSSKCEDTMKISILQEFETIFQDPMTNIHIKMEIADIYLLNNRIRRGNEMLDIIRDTQRNVQNQAHVFGERELDRGNIREDDTSPSTHKTIYSDTQNVHDTNINSSVINSCVHLITMENCPPFDIESVKNELFSICDDDIRSKRAIEIVLERIQIDMSVFRSGDNSFTLHNVFSALWSFINKHTDKDEIKKILVQEIIAMFRYCSTGLLSRFINVIQGFHNVPELDIKISSRDQISAVITNFLNMTIMEEDLDEIFESMISQDKQIFLDFVKSEMNEKIPSLISEYDLDTQDYEDIVYSVKKYTKYEDWSVTDGILSFCKK